MSEKIATRHTARKAIVYVRQSSAYQVANNTESQRLQYAMQERLRELGWSEIEIIDEDLGRSAAGAATRAGFERLVAEVCMGEVGAVAARELSRFARNSRDWQKLVEVCRMVDTLLVDQEMIYDARRSNDRLLLGLKGSLNEYELDLLRQRAWEARFEKARRGELLAWCVAGYEKTWDGRWELDPDERVQSVLRLLFRKVLELGSGRQLALWLIEQGIQVPVRRRLAGQWQTQWRRATYARIYRLLTNPIYAGAYAYGRAQRSTEYDEGRVVKRMRNQPRARWHALIQNHHEGYVSWDEFERIQQMLNDNSNFSSEASHGAPKRGPALLAGLVRCRRCGRKLMVTYTGRGHGVLRYVCCRGALDNAEPRCIGFGGTDADRAVSRELVRVVQPAAIDAAVRAGQAASQATDEVRGVLQRDLQAARYAADRAFQQFDAADPKNRLVADELERRWNRALQSAQELERRLKSHNELVCRSTPPDAQAFAGLAAQLGEIWEAPDTDVRLKKRLLRTLIREVVAEVDNTVGTILLVIHWQGGAHTELTLRRRKIGQNRLHTAPETVEVVRQLVRVLGDDLIASYLNRAGLRTGRGNRWTRERVVSLRQKHDIARQSGEDQKPNDWLNLTEAAKHLGISHTTLRQAAERGDIPALHPLPNGPWIFSSADLDTEAARKIVQRVSRRRSAAPSPQQRNLGFFGK